MDYDVFGAVGDVLAPATVTEPTCKKMRTADATQTVEWVLLTMGEAMLRFAPIDSQPPATPTRHLPQPFLRSLGGDELNVAVALAQLGVRTRWISVIPTGPLGDVVIESCRQHDIEFGGLRVEGADLGIFTTLPESGIVHYQRRHSAFALHNPSDLDWVSTLQNPSARRWLHMTGITPLVSENALESWRRAFSEALKQGIPCSLDLNHRPQLGSLADLWREVSVFVGSLELIVLSVGQLQDLTRLHGLQVPEELPNITPDQFDTILMDAMCKLQVFHWKCKHVALCRKTRDKNGLQRRWSLLTSLADGADKPVIRSSTESAPVFHRPMDDLGGGSAWLAGFLDGYVFNPSREQTRARKLQFALRRAELLAALCQECKGDFSQVSRSELQTEENKFSIDEPATVGGAEKINAPLCMMLNKPLSPDIASSRLDSTLAALKRAGVVSIIRAKGSPEVAVARALELASLGCKAVEVTMDSCDWPSILRELSQKLPQDVVLGIGTVMDESVCEIGKAAALGATFALSPIDPQGFVEECHRRGVLAVPSGFTSNECWRLHSRGARLIKLFHAGSVGPSVLKSILDVTPMRAMNILPSGGVSPENAAEWWAAGAALVGMGSNLVGRDVGLPVGSDAFKKSSERWQQTERDVARQLFSDAASRARDCGY